MMTRKMTGLPCLIRVGSGLLPKLNLGLFGASPIGNPMEKSMPPS